MSEPNDLTEASDRLLGELRGMITDAREQLAQTANAALTMLYWNLGSRLHRRFSARNMPNTASRLSPQWGDIVRRVWKRLPCARPTAP